MDVFGRCVASQIFFCILHLRPCFLFLSSELHLCSYYWAPSRVFKSKNTFCVIIPLCLSLLSKRIGQIVKLNGASQVTLDDWHHEVYRYFGSDVWMYLHGNKAEWCLNVWTAYTVWQGSPSSVLEGRCSAEFSSNPNQTHLKQLIKVLLGILQTSREVCWGKLEPNSAGHRPSRIKFDDPCCMVYLLYGVFYNWESKENSFVIPRTKENKTEGDRNQEGRVLYWSREIQYHKCHATNAPPRLSQP